VHVGYVKLRVLEFAEELGDHDELEEPDGVRQNVKAGPHPGYHQESKEEYRYLLVSSRLEDARDADKDVRDVMKYRDKRANAVHVGHEVAEVKRHGHEVMHDHLFEIALAAAEEHVSNQL